MVTMLLGGLWHGANLKFVVWGGIHGVSLVLHKLWTSHSPRVRRADSWWRRAVGAFFTFQLGIVLLDFLPLLHPKLRPRHAWPDFHPVWYQLHSSDALYPMPNLLP